MTDPHNEVTIDPSSTIGTQFSLYNYKSTQYWSGGIAKILIPKFTPADLKITGCYQIALKIGPIPNYDNLQFV